MLEKASIDLNLEAVVCYLDSWPLAAGVQCWDNLCVEKDGTTPALEMQVLTWVLLLWSKMLLPDS